MLVRGSVTRHDSLLVTACTLESEPGTDTAAMLSDDKLTPGQPARSSSAADPARSPHR